MQTSTEKIFIYRKFIRYIIVWDDYTYICIIINGILCTREKYPLTWTARYGLP